jgi:hypothetical protein
VLGDLSEDAGEANAGGSIDELEEGALEAATSQVVRGRRENNPAGLA